MGDWPKVIDTVRQHVDDGYTLTAHCYGCQRQVPVDLQALLPKHADTPTRRLTVRCKVCGKVGQKIMHTPRWTKETG